MAPTKTKRASMSGNRSGNSVSNNWPFNFNWMQVMQPTVSTDREMPENLTNLYSTMMQAGQEFSELCTKRTRAYMELPNMVSSCKTPEDLAYVEIEFWDNAYDQYKDFSSHSLPGPLSALGGMIDGQIPDGAEAHATKSRSTSKVQAKRKSPTKRKATRKRAGNTKDIGSGIFSFPEHVEGRQSTRGRIH